MRDFYYDGLSETVDLRTRRNNFISSCLDFKGEITDFKQQHGPPLFLESLTALPRSHPQRTSFFGEAGTASKKASKKKPN